MTDRFTEWLQRFREALESRDAAAFAKLFTEGAEYFESPFATPLRGRGEIRESLAEFAASRANVHFEFELLCSDASRGAVWWRLVSNVIATGHEVEVDGIFLFWLEQDGQCSHYREWWHKRERVSNEPEMAR